MMGMSLYTSISVIAFVVVAIVGIVIKIMLRIERKKSDGVHGFVHGVKVDESAHEDWELL